ncbi:hypothetical protein BH09BAC3_BH09BAC3_06620 [soil metagenome]
MKKIILFFFLGLFWIGCSNESKTSTLEVRLTDAPGDYEEVNIDIQRVEVNNTDGNDAWKSLDINRGVYNLLKLTNGLDTLLGRIELPAGRITQIRLVLGANNSVKVGGQKFSLNTPSAQQSGLKINVQAQLTEGVTYKILLDFDAARSIVKTGNGSYNLKPVIRSLVAAQSGGIKGTVSPFAAAPAIFAIVGQDTVATSYPDGTGKFLLRGVPAGTYVVSFIPKPGYQPLQKSNVTVTTGNVIDLGNVTMQ